jgi:8-oxo-dGTP diphosphatase
MAKRVHVAVAVIVNADNEVLLALRQAHQHQGNLWEFPGGKLEPGEQPYDALVREIKEEIALDVHEASPLIEVSHDYGDKQVFLDVWHVTQFQGEPVGLEGQRIRWCHISAIDSRTIPIANLPILDALKSHIAL